MSRKHYLVHPEKIREKNIKKQITMFEVVRDSAKRTIPDWEERPDVLAALSKIDCSLQSFQQMLSTGLPHGQE